MQPPQPLRGVRWRAPRGTAALFIATVCVLIPFGAAQCPHQCSQRGICSVDATCECFTGFTGADCSRRECHIARRMSLPCGVRGGAAGGRTPA